MPSPPGAKRYGPRLLVSRPDRFDGDAECAGQPDGGVDARQSLARFPGGDVRLPGVDAGSQRPLATVNGPVSVSPTYAAPLQEADAMLDSYLDTTRAIDRAVLAGLDEDEPVNLDAVIGDVLASYTPVAPGEVSDRSDTSGRGLASSSTASRC